MGALSCGYARRVLFLTRAIRMFAYGALSVVLLLHLRAVGLLDSDVGFLLTLIVLGDLALSLFLTTRADTVLGRRCTLALGALLMAGSGAGFALSGGSLPALWLCGTLGVVSISGGEIGPFVPVEQAALAEGDAAHLGPLLGYYAAAGYGAGAVGAAAGGGTVASLVGAGWGAPARAYLVVLWAYAGCGAVMAALYCTLPPSVEPPPSPQPPPPPPPPPVGAPLFASPRVASPLLGWCRCTAPTMGLTRPESRAAIARLSALFAVDAFAGGLVMQSALALFFHVQWGWGEAALGALLFSCSALGGLSSVVAGHLVARFGAVNTAVYTHLPSNVLLLAVPLMPSGAWSAAALLLRFCLSQMDVPARQAFVAGVVAPHERSAASGITNVVRSLGLAASPLLLGAVWGGSSGSGGAALWAPFAVAAMLTTFYDLALLVMGRSLEKAAAAANDTAAAPAMPAPTSPACDGAQLPGASAASGGGQPQEAPPPAFQEAPPPALTEQEVAVEERMGLLEGVHEDDAGLWTAALNDAAEASVM